MVREKIEDESSKESTANVLKKASRRGRWLDIRSVQVYTKTHLLVRMLEKTDPEALRRGAYIGERLEVLGAVCV